MIRERSESDWKPGQAGPRLRRVFCMFAVWLCSATRLPVGIALMVGVKLSSAS